MVIDIDSFLNKYDGEDKKSSSSKDISTVEGKKEVKPSINMDFEKDIGKSLDNAQLRADEGDLNILKKIYDEVKKFDENIPSKFFNIEEKSALTLERVGNKYAKDIFENNKKIKLHITLGIKAKIEIINKEIMNENFSKVLVEFQNIKNHMKTFPKGFLEDWMRINSQIKELEITIYNSIDSYKNKKLVEVKKQVKNMALELKRVLKSKDFHIINTTVEKIESNLSNIPRILASHMVEESQGLLKMISKAQNYSCKLQILHFNEKKTEFYNLVGKFKEYKLKKNLEGCLLAYNEVVSLFDKIPDIIVEEKIKMYDEMNKMFSSINTLVINGNMELFLETYNAGKAIEEIRDYLEHVKISKEYNVESLKSLHGKIEEIPDKYVYEKNELMKTIKSLISQWKREEIDKKKKSKAIAPKEKKDLVKKSSSLVPSKKLSNNDIKGELNELFYLMKNTNDVNELKKVANKMKAHIKMLDMPDSEKKKIVLKIKNKVRG